MDQTLNRKDNTKKIILVVACFINSMIGVGYVITSWNGLLPTIAEEFGWTTAQWGALAGALPLGSAIMAVIGGVLYDKFSPRKLLIATLITLGIAMALRGYVSSFVIAYMVAMFGGIASCMIDVGAQKIVTLWFDREQLYKVTGILFCAGSLGYFVGFNLSVMLTNLLNSWQHQFIFAGAFLVAWSLVWIFMVPERSREENALDKDLGVDTNRVGILESFKMLVKSRQAVLCILTEMCSSSMILTFSSIGPLAFTTFWGCSTAEATFILSSSSLAGIGGYVIMPIIADKIGRRKPLGGLAIPFSCAMYCCGLLTQNFALALVMTMCAGFMNGWGMVMPRILMLESKEVGGRIAGVAMGVFVTLAKVTCSAFPVLFSALYIAWGEDISGLLKAWIFMYAVFGGLGTIFIWCTKETGKKVTEKLS